MLEGDAAPLDGLLCLLCLQPVENTRHHRIVVHVVTVPLICETTRNGRLLPAPRTTTAGCDIEARKSPHDLGT